MLRFPAIVWVSVLVVVVSVGMLSAVVARGDEAADASVTEARPASGQSYDFGCANLTIGLELLDEIQHPFELTCYFQGLIWDCSSILAGAITCDHPIDNFSWVCTEQGSENAYCARGGLGSRDTNCAKTGGEINCTGGTEPSFTDCASSGPSPNWDCTTPVGAFHCDADTNDWACGLEGEPTPTASAAPTATPAGQELGWGDVDCNGQITVRDNQALLRFALSQQPLSQTEPCPDVGTEVGVSP